MPWYAVLKMLPAGYDNRVQQVWYLDKTYRVSSHSHETTAVHTPHLETKVWYLNKNMAKRLFDKPYYVFEQDGVVQDEFELQPYHEKAIAAYKQYKQQELDQKLKYNQEIKDIKRDVEKLRSGGWSYDNI